jgi:DNA-3-methyladenine glycosylase
MFEAGGIAYVYLVYGVHHCLNIVTGSEGYPAAILLRAAESPGGGVSASGPGRLSRAFHVDCSLDRAPFTGRELWLEPGEPVSDRQSGTTSRIGVDYAGPWARRRFRYVIRRHPSLSGPRWLNNRAR